MKKIKVLLVLGVQVITLSSLVAAPVEKIVDTGEKVNVTRKSVIDPYDINNYKRSIKFSGYNFKVKDSSISPSGTLGPNHNIFSDEEENVKIGDKGQLILRLTPEGKTWKAAEIVSEDEFKYGKYLFYVSSKVDQIDEHVTFSMFLYADDENEIDIEFSDFYGYNSQFIVQPYFEKNHIQKYQSVLKGTHTSYVIDYQKDYIAFEAYHGHNVYNKNNLISKWTYKENIPSPENMHLRFNLYIRHGEGPKNKKPFQMTIDKFDYIPAYHGENAGI